MTISLTHQEFLWISPARRTAITAPRLMARIGRSRDWVDVVLVEGPTVDVRRWQSEQRAMEVTV
jgi:hypothetical protein